MPEILLDFVKHVFDKFMKYPFFARAAIVLSAFFVLAPAAIYVALHLLGLEMFLKDAGVYYTLCMGYVFVVYGIGLAMPGFPTIKVLLWSGIVFMAFALGVNLFKFLTGTYVPILQ